MKILLYSSATQFNLYARFIGIFIAIVTHLQNIKVGTKSPFTR